LNVTSFLPGLLALVAGETTKPSAAMQAAVTDSKIDFFIKSSARETRLHLPVSG